MDWARLKAKWGDIEWMGGQESPPALKWHRFTGQISDKPSMFSQIYFNLAFISYNFLDNIPKNDFLFPELVFPLSFFRVGRLHSKLCWRSSGLAISYFVFVDFFSLNSFRMYLCFLSVVRFFLFFSLLLFFLVEWVLSTTFSSKPKEPSFSLNQSIYLLFLFSRLMHFLFSKPFQFPWVIFCFRHISHSLWYAPKYTVWCDSFLFGLQQIRCADHWFRVVVFLRCFFSNFGSLNDIKW